MDDRGQPGLEQMTVLGPEAEFQGRLICRGPARILGAFEGEILSEHEVHIGEGAECRAAVQAASIVVEGLMEGDLTASDRVQLGPKARVRGDLIAAGLIVAEGASFCGHCTVGPEVASTPSARSGAAVSESAKAPRVETRAIKPSTPTTPKAPTTPTTPAIKPGADSLALATAELENDPEWQSLSR